MQRIVADLIDGRWIAVVGNQFGGAPGQTRDYLDNVRMLRAVADEFDRREEEERRLKKKRKRGEVSHEEVFGEETGVNLTPVTNTTETGDIHDTPRVTSTTETGDAGVTQSTIDPPVDPSDNLSQPAAPAAPLTVLVPDDKETALQAACRATWSAYSDAYERRYGAKPVRNAQVNAGIKQFVQRLGYEESPMVAAWFVDFVNEAFVLRNGHAVWVLVKSAEAYRTQWVTGRGITSTRAKQADRMAAAQDTAADAIAMARSRRAANNA